MKNRTDAPRKTFRGQLSLQILSNNQLRNRITAATRY